MAGKGFKPFIDEGHKASVDLTEDISVQDSEPALFEQGDQEQHSEKKGLDEKPKFQRQVSLNDPASYVLDFPQPQQTKKRNKEQLTVQSLFEQHILKGSATFHMSPCCTLVSAFGDCHDYKWERFIRFFEKSAITRGGMAFTPTLKRLKKDPKCLSQFELVVLGNYPFKDFAWRISISNTDTAILSLLSYLSSTCKTREVEFEFDKNMQDTLSSDLDPILKKEVVKLYEKTTEAWEMLQKDKPLLHEIQAGISLINVLNIGSGNAVHDFLPILNRYCKWSMHLACYKEDDMLANAPPEEFHANPKYAQAPRCLKGCVSEEQVVMATRLECKEDKKPKEQWRNENIEQAIKKETGISVEHLSVPVLEMKDTKTKLEETVVQSQFHSIVYLRELLLLQVIRRKSSHTFWMKRSDIEAIAKQLKFINGSVDQFLRVFTLFGCLFHAHDIPALNEYVITDIFKFTQQMQQIYDETLRNGLFKRRSNNDTKMILWFLVNLGKALRINSTQIRDPSLPEDVYYYIPSARDCCHLSNDTTDDSIKISFDKCVAENLQVCLCHELFQTGGQLVPQLVPNEGDPNVTVITLQGTEIQFKESIKDVRITLLNEQAADASRKIEIYSHILPRHPNLLTPSEAKLSYTIHVSNELTLGSSQNKFEEKLSKIKNKTPCCMNPEIVDPVRIAHIAVLLAEKHSDHLERLMEKFQTTYNETLQSCGTKTRILYMLTEYLKTATTYDFNAKLTELGIQENTTKADLYDY